MRYPPLPNPDPLTGLLSTRVFLEELKDRSAGGRGSLLMANIDSMKLGNQLLGHDEIDAVIVDLARTVRDHFGTTALIGGTGGDYLVWDDIPLEQYVDIAEHWRQHAHALHAGHRAKAIEAAKAQGCARVPVDQMLTLTVAIAPMQLWASDVVGAFDELQLALDRAKKEGGNRVRVETERRL